MKRAFYYLTTLALFSSQSIFAQQNPVFPGWYADPEGIVYNNEYWIFPTYSAPYEEQILFDAFSSKDLVNWKKHERILDNKAIRSTTSTS